MRNNSIYSGIVCLLMIFFQYPSVVKAAEQPNECPPGKMLISSENGKECVEVNDTNLHAKTENSTSFVVRGHYQCDREKLEKIENNYSVKIMFQLRDGSCYEVPRRTEVACQFIDCLNKKENGEVIERRVKIKIGENNKVYYIPFQQKAKEKYAQNFDFCAKISANDIIKQGGQPSEKETEILFETRQYSNNAK